MVKKTEGGVEYPSDAYAYVPDAQEPSTWKLRLWDSPESKETTAQVGAAVAALGKGFRGNTVEIPSEDRAKVLARVRSAWKKVNSDKSTDDMPDVLKANAEDDDSHDYMNPNHRGKGPGGGEFAPKEGGDGGDSGTPKGGFIGTRGATAADRLETHGSRKTDAVYDAASTMATTAYFGFEDADPKMAKDKAVGKAFDHYVGAIDKAYERSRNVFSDHADLLGTAEGGKDVQDAGKAYAKAAKQEVGIFEADLKGGLADMKKAVGDSTAGKSLVAKWSAQLPKQVQRLSKHYEDGLKHFLYASGRYAEEASFETFAASASGDDISGDGEGMVDCPECGNKTMSKSKGKCSTCGAIMDLEADNSDQTALRLHMNPNHRAPGPGGGQFAPREGGETGLKWSGNFEKATDIHNATGEVSDLAGALTSNDTEETLQSHERLASIADEIKNKLDAESRQMDPHEVAAWKKVWSAATRALGGPNYSDQTALRLHINPNHDEKGKFSFGPRGDQEHSGFKSAGGGTASADHPGSKISVVGHYDPKKDVIHATVHHEGKPLADLEYQPGRSHDPVTTHIHDRAGMAAVPPTEWNTGAVPKSLSNLQRKLGSVKKKYADSAEVRTYAAADGISFRIGKQRPYASSDIAMPYPMPTDAPGTDENGGEGPDDAEDWSEVPYSVQAVIFNRDQFTLTDAMAWLKDNNFWSSSWLESPTFLEFKLMKDNWFEPASLITVDAKTYDAQEAFKVYQKTHDVNGIEIFKTGKWNGDDYDEKDLDDMVSAFDKVGYQPPVKLGHENAPGERAWGWVSKIYRKGKVLLADLKDVPAELYKQIKERAFDHVSSEIFWNLERDGTKHRRALKAIALLGAETPAVSGLAPLRTAVMSAEAGDVRTYNMSTEELEMDKIAQLTATIADLRKQIAAGGDTKKVAELSDNLKKSEDEREKLYTEQAKKLADQDKTIETLTGSVKSLTETVTTLSEAAQNAAIKAAVDRCQVPAFRPALTALYELSAQSPSRVAKYTEGDKTAELNGAGLLDKIVEVINQNAAKLFGAKTTATVPGKDYDTPNASTRPDLDMETAINKYFAEHPAAKPGKPTVAEYKAAQKAVAALNPELARQYAEFTAPRVH